MKLVQREYRPGDEFNINKLYKIVSGIDRSVQEYEWEWIKTWDGKGSIWLALDEDRNEEDRLIMQYSLIPTPFSFWGKPYLAGKTENCMCHPDYRGQHIYFPHERKHFEEAKKRFQTFFTTAGDATKGAPGAVRRKLGYIAFDAWAHYLFCIERKYWEKILFTRLKKKLKFTVLVKLVLKLISYIFSLYFYFVFPCKPSGDIRIFNKHDAPLDEIVNLWNRNKQSYMITVDRIRSYIEWRINQNPYFDYKYLFYYKQKRLVGYAIFTMNKYNVCEITDILVDNGDASLFKIIIDYLVHHVRDIGGSAVLCRTLLNNLILKKVFSETRFLNMYKIRRILARQENPLAFHVYVSKDIESKNDPFEPQNWYVTDLLTEGRTH